MKTRLIGLLFLATLLPACVTYRDFPEDLVNKPPQTKPFDKLYYTLQPFGVLGTGSGEEALRMVFQRKTPFTTTEKVDAAPAHGLYCNVEVLYKPPTLPALAFGYLSISTLTLIPVWSNHDGYRVIYHLYADGKQEHQYEYDITRKGAVWIGLLPIIWVNAFTYSEAEALEATTYQFFKDAEPTFLAYRNGKR